MVWNDDVCIRRARSVHQLDSDILVSAKLQLYQQNTDVSSKSAVSVLFNNFWQLNTRPSQMVTHNK